MPVYIAGSKGKNFYVGSNKIKKIYVGTNQVYSSGNIVTYHVDSGVTYQEEVEEGASCLSPKTFTPTKSGWTFLGWRSDATATTNVYASLVMGDAPKTLYAVFVQTIYLYTIANGTTTPYPGTRIYNNGNVINPSYTVSNPSKSGASFLGWSDTATTTVTRTSISNLTLSESLVTYAVFKYANSSLYALTDQLVYNRITLKQHQGVTEDKKPIAPYALPACNTDIYDRVSITAIDSNCSVNTSDGYGWRYINVWYSIGNSSSEIVSQAGFSDTWTGHGMQNPANWNGSSRTFSFSAQGTQTLYLNAKLYEGNGFCSGGAYLNQFNVRYLGRTVVG